MNNKAQNILWLTLGRGFNAFVYILLLPFMARALEYDEYATYGQVLMIIEIALLFISIASNQYIYVLFAKSDQKSQKEIIFNGALISFCLSALFVLFIYLSQSTFAKLFDNPNIEGNLLKYSLCAFPLLIISTFDFVLFYFGKFKKAVTIQVVFNLIKVAIIVCSVQLCKAELFKSIEAIFTGFIGLHIFIAIIYSLSMPIEWHKGTINFEIISSFLKYGYTVGITMVIGTLIKRTDGFMISYMIEKEDYAIYRMGALEIPFLMLLFSSIITVVLPSVTKLFHEHKIQEICALKKKAISSSVVGIYPSLVFALMFAFPVLEVYFGQAYLGSISVFFFYNLILFIRVNDYRDVLIAASKTRLIFRIDMSIFLLNLVLNYFFIQHFGILGAVWATVISMALLSFTLLNVTMKILNVSHLSFFDFRLMGITLVSSFICASIGLYMYFIFENIYLVPIIFAIYLLVVYYSIVKLSPSALEIIEVLKRVIKVKRNG